MDRLFLLFGIKRPSMRASDETDFEGPNYRTGYATHFDRDGIANTMPLIRSAGFVDSRRGFDGMKSRKRRHTTRF
jgi:hypothetical protein